MHVDLLPADRWAMCSSMGTDERSGAEVCAEVRSSAACRPSASINSDREQLLTPRDELIKSGADSFEACAEVPALSSESGERSDESSPGPSPVSSSSSEQLSGCSLQL